MVLKKLSLDSLIDKVIKDLWSIIDELQLKPVLDHEIKIIRKTIIRNATEKLFLVAPNDVALVTDELYEDFEYALANCDSPGNRLKFEYLVEKHALKKECKDLLKSEQWHHCVDKGKIQGIQLVSHPLRKMYLLLNNNSALIYLPNSNGIISSGHRYHSDNPLFVMKCNSVYEGLMKEVESIESLRNLRDYFKILGMPYSLHVLKTLREQPGLKLKDICDHTALAENTMSERLTGLSSAGLILERNETFYLSELGENAYQQSYGQHFIIRYRDYFEKHKTSNIPELFRFSLGYFMYNTELLDSISSVTDHIKRIYENAYLNKEQNRIRAVKSEVSEQTIKIAGTVAHEHLTCYHYILPRIVRVPKNRKDLLREYDWPLLLQEQIIERKMLETVSAVLISNGCEALAAFPHSDRDTVDLEYAFYGEDPKYVAWVENYIDYLWNQASPLVSDDELTFIEH